ncbi:hypothetical protein CHELA17_60047 [Chelatococcus asaccharovorans]|nr:hypothetical protein CHELA17_60047 [Chelatococcus asaccharovorans]
MESSDTTQIIEFSHLFLNDARPQQTDLLWHEPSMIAGIAIGASRLRFADCTMNNLQPEERQIRGTGHNACAWPNAPWPKAPWPNAAWANAGWPNHS